MSRFLLLVVVFLLSGGLCLAQGVPEPLGDTATVNDYAKLLTPEDSQAIETLATDLWGQHGVTLVVVTIEAMKTYPDLPQDDFSSFTAAWYKAWVLDNSEAEARTLNLFISKEDRIARVIPGSDYPVTIKHDLDLIFLNDLIPHLKKNEWSVGITATATSLAKLANNIGAAQEWQPLSAPTTPAPPVPTPTAKSG